MNVARLKRDLDRSDASRKDRRRARTQLDVWRERQRAASRTLEALVAPEASRLDAAESRLTERSALSKQQDIHRDWVAEHPEAARRLDHFASEIDARDERLQRGRGVPERGIGRGRPGAWTPPPMARELDRGIDLGM